MTTCSEVPHLMMRDKYGDAIDNLAVNTYIVIQPEERQRVLHLIKRKYRKESIPKAEQRVYRTITHNDNGGVKELRLFRLK